MHYLFPASELNPARVDEHFAEQAAAVAELGYEYFLVDLTVLSGSNPGKLLRGRLPESGVVRYRGWMLTPQTYKTLEESLNVKGFFLETSSEAYKKAHELPGWYDCFASYTAFTLEWDKEESLVDQLSQFPTGVWLRDYSKSLKHEEGASFIRPHATEDEALATLNRFEELRGEHLAGGVLLRAFEKFTGPELRTWWVKGELRAVTNHPDTPKGHGSSRLLEWNFMPEGFAEAMRLYGAPFVTADFVWEESLGWRLVEVGDGGVSDLPTDQNFADFFRGLG